MARPSDERVDTYALGGTLYFLLTGIPPFRSSRLLTAEEWEQAASTPGFVAADGLLEWIDSPDDKKRQVHAKGKTATRPDAKHKDVTFRMAKSL